MSSIRSILQDYGRTIARLIDDDNREPRDRFALQQEINYAFDQALKNISELIDGAKPEQYPISELNIGVDEYQSNLKELLK